METNDETPAVEQQLPEPSPVEACEGLDAATERLYLFYHFMEAYYKVVKLANTLTGLAESDELATVNRKFLLTMNWLLNYVKYIYKQDGTDTADSVALLSEIRANEQYHQCTMNFFQRHPESLGDLLRDCYEFSAEFAQILENGRVEPEETKAMKDENSTKFLEKEIIPCHCRFIAFVIKINKCRFNIAESELIDFDYEVKDSTSESAARFRSLIASSLAINSTKPSFCEPKSLKADALKRLDEGEINQREFDLCDKAQYTALSHYVAYKVAVNAVGRAECSCQINLSESSNDSSNDSSDMEMDEEADARLGLVVELLSEELEKYGRSLFQQ